MKWDTSNRKNIKPAAWAASFAAHALVLAALAYAPTGEFSEPSVIEVVLSFPETAAPGPETSVPAAPVVRDSVVRKDAVPVRPLQAVQESAGLGPVAAEPAPLAEATGGALSQEAMARELSASELYLAEIKKLLDRRKTYPMAARRLGKQGTVVVRFTLSREGKILSAEVVQPSGHDLLNEAARNLINQIDGFQPFPQEITRASMNFKVPVEYHL